MLICRLVNLSISRLAEFSDFLGNEFGYPSVILRLSFGYLIAKVMGGLGRLGGLGKLANWKISRLAN